MRRHGFSVVFMIAVCVVSAWAQSAIDIKRGVESVRPADFPRRPIEMMVPTPAGGGLDTAARLLTRSAEKFMEHAWAVNNRVGAGGFVGFTWLATQAPKDGSAVGIVSPTIFGDSFLRAQGKWTYQDLEPIAFLNYEPVTWVVSTDGRFKDTSLKEIVTLARADPGKITVAVAAQTVFEFLAEQIEDAGGAKFNKVPFQGGAPALTALLGNHIDISFGYLSEFRGYMEAGKLRPIAVASQVRSPFLPDVPTVNEVLGGSPIVRVSFRYVAAPKGMPAANRKYLSAGLEAALDDPALAAEYTKVGAIMDRRLNTPEAVNVEVEKLATLEREFFIKTGRMNP